MRLAPKRAVASFAAAAASAAVLVAEPSAAWAGPGKHRDCIVYSGLTEVTHLSITDGGEPGEGAGDVVDFHTELLDADGDLVGRNVGRAVVFADPATGRLKEFVTGIDYLPGGTVASAGTIDLISAVSGQEQSIGAVGVSGRFRGKVGARTFRLIERTSPIESISESGVSVCRR
jgi:hypothetical protein